MKREEITPKAMELWVKMNEIITLMRQIPALDNNATVLHDRFEPFFHLVLDAPTYSNLSAFASVWQEAGPEVMALVAPFAKEP